MFKDENGNISSKSGESYLTICYERLAPVFVEAIKELTSQIKELKEENKLIKKELDNIKKIITTNYLN
jgi:phage shock protein A